MNIDLICKIVNGKLNNNKYKNRKINYFRIDSRLTTKKDCFITVNDGYKYVNNKMGLIITDHDISLNVPIIRVEDSKYALELIARYKRNNFKGEVIGITGSMGKTTTKELVSNILSSKYKVLKSYKNYNNHYGLPLTLANLSDEEVIILELGMNHKGEIKKLSEICRPTIGVITSIASSHIGNLKSKRNIYKAKMEILSSMESKDLIVCGDSKYFKKSKFIKCGIGKHNDLYGYNITNNLDGLKFNIMLDKEYEINFNCGINFVTDILIAIQLGLIFNIGIEEIIDKIKNTDLLDHRMNIYNGDITLIDDSYNASYESVISDIDLVKDIDKNKILIIGNVLEMGKYSKKIHRKIYKKLLKVSKCKIILVGKEFNKYGSFNDYKEVIEYLKNYDIKDELILLKGSRKVELDKIKDYLMDNFKIKKSL